MAGGALAARQRGFAVRADHEGLLGRVDGRIDAAVGSVAQFPYAYRKAQERRKDD